MKKELKWLTVATIFLLFIFPGCIFNKKTEEVLPNQQETVNPDTLSTDSHTPQLKGKKTNFTLEDLENIESNLDDFQIVACISADQYNKCEKLPGLNLVTYEECCEELDKCCQNE